MIALARRLRRFSSGFAFSVGLWAFVGAGAVQAQGVTVPEHCTGHFVNPITDVCWGCLFPLTVGSIPIFPSSHADGPNPASPICVCAAPPPVFLKVGLSIGFWEPVRLEDVTSKAFCFPDLGGLDIPIGFGFPSMSQHSIDQEQHTTGYHVHWYIYPLMYWLELLTDFLCLEQTSFDIGYISEFDPTWNDDEISVFLAPETLLFENPIAGAACALDCVQSTVTGMGNPAMYWCAGCQGAMFPLVGHVTGETGQVNGGLLAGERFAFKMHRELLALGTSGPQAVCGKYLMPIMDKRQYRFQVVNPSSFVPLSILQCPAIGVDSTLWETGKIVPFVGDDLGFLIWRKDNCCVGL